MKKNLLAAGVVAIMGGAAVPAYAQADADTSVVLRQVEVVANRANDKTPVAFTNLAVDL